MGMAAKMASQCQVHVWLPDKHKMDLGRHRPGFNHTKYRKMIHEIWGISDWTLLSFYVISSREQG